MPAACPSCTAANNDTSKFCSECGSTLKPEYEATVAHDASADVGPGSRLLSSSKSSHRGRFLPGSKIAGRYRIVSLIGQGGMGEVYRADDLKLDHAVALKFLPRDFGDDPQRLEFFHNEVRLSRQISHPNICRVYDIGEIDGQHFLSMEYIDGEDLRGLLRRIGRLPRDKGVDLARQLCAGVAAAHDRGILHRDLKPANVMIDGRGQVRITDFGLARLVDDGPTSEVAGTPAYMAPEQLARGETTIQSDLYSLGLILYELFTGKPVFAAKSIPDLRRAHEESGFTYPSALVHDIDPAVDRIIRRCLEKEPHERPKSVHAVAAALPGGDPLAAALAAGETPSPQLVAAAGKNAGLSPRWATAALAGLAVILVLSCRLSDETVAVNQAGLVHPPAVLTDAAKRIITEDFGYADPPDDSTHGFRTTSEGIRFWYRQRANDVPIATEAYWAEGWGQPSRVRPDFEMPKWTVPGELGLELMPDKRLTYFRALPNQKVHVSHNPATPAWSDWFTPEVTGFYLPRDVEDAEAAKSAGIEVHVLDVVKDRFRTPPDAFDAVGVWKGLDPTTKEEFYVEATAFAGRPTYFNVLTKDEFETAWSADAAQGPTELKLGRDIVMWLYFILLVSGAALAWYNLQAGRGDRRGAFRLAVFAFCADAVIWLAYTRHSSDITIETGVVITIGLSQVLFTAARCWVWYLALEPFVRRVWPRILISWTRLLDGRWRDRLVGRDVLLGLLAGTVSYSLFNGNSFVQKTMSNSAPLFAETRPLALAGSKELLGTALDGIMFALFVAMFMLMLLLSLRILLRTERRAIIGWVIVTFTFATLIRGGNLVITVVPVALQAALMLTMLVRFGFLAFVAQESVLFVFEAFPLTTNTDAWYFNHGLFAVGSIAAISLLAYRTSLGDRPLLSLEER